MHKQQKRSRLHTTSLKHAKKKSTQQVNVIQRRNLHYKPPKRNSKTKRWLVSWGSNATKGLGHSHYDPKSKYVAHPQRVPIPYITEERYLSPGQPLDITSAENDENTYADVLQVSSGWTTNFALTDVGQVWTWGAQTSTRTMLKQYHWENGNSIQRLLSKVSPWRLLKKDLGILRLPCFGMPTKHLIHLEARSTGISLPEWVEPEHMVPQQVISHGDNRAILTTSGHVYTWGEFGDAYGNIGRSVQVNQNYKIALVPLPLARDIALGYHHLVVCAKNGDVYTSGLAEYGATGLPLAFLNLKPKKKNIHIPISIHTNYEYFVADLTAAYNSLKSTKLANIVENESTNNTERGDINDDSDDETTQHQQVYKMSGNKYDPIDLKNFNAPSPIPIPPKFTRAKQEHSRAENESKNMLNAYQDQDKFAKASLNNNLNSDMRITPENLVGNLSKYLSTTGIEAANGVVNPLTALIKGKLPKTLPKFKGVACGMASTLFLDEDNNVWSCGRNAHGELGHTIDLTYDTHKTSEKYIPGQTLINALNPVDFRQYFYPVKIEQVEKLSETLGKVVKMVAGIHHSALLTEHGHVITFGSNEYGQCGRLNELPTTIAAQKTLVGKKLPWSLPPGQLQIPQSVLNGATIIDITAGYYDTVLILSDGRCLTVGSHLSKLNRPQALYSMANFEPLTPNIRRTLFDHEQSNNDNSSDDDDDNDDDDDKNDISDDDVDDEEVNFSSKHLIQTIPNVEKAPFEIYADVKKYEEETMKSSVIKEQKTQNDFSYFAHQMSIGFAHALAIVSPRTREQIPMKNDLFEKYEEIIAANTLETDEPQEPESEPSKDASTSDTSK